jgi:hypothetical protein
MQLRYIGENCTLKKGEIYETRVRFKQDIFVTAVSVDFGYGCVGTWNCQYKSIKDLAEHWEVPNP